MAGEHDLGRLIAGLSPRLDPQPWVFVTIARLPPNIDPLMTFREEEGLTCIVRPEEATDLGLSDRPAFRRITLSVASSLEAVGLTAAVASALTAVGISANIVAAFHHDHVFVPADRADEAVDRLERLQRRE
jgi:uncharacterized protein